MKNELSREQIKNILDELNRAVDEGPWESSKFLNAIGNKLEQIRDEFAEHVTVTQQTHEAEENKAHRKVQEGQQEIYISLYSAQGSRIQNWVSIISNLPRQIISRPVYEREEDIKEAIRAKANKVNEGYVSIIVNQTDILPVKADRVPKDKLGRELLTLKDNAIYLENINRFEHTSGTYHFKSGRLIKRD
tara:strand:- start:644 stop:1213 length:570 start_codon:yes stop_codon:yes gene_type:complete